MKWFSPGPASFLGNPICLTIKYRALSVFLPLFSVAVKLDLVFVLELVWAFPSHLLDDGNLCLPWLYDPEPNMDSCLSLSDSFDLCSWRNTFQNGAWEQNNSVSFLCDFKLLIHKIESSRKQVGLCICPPAAANYLLHICHQGESFPIFCLPFNLSREHHGKSVEVSVSSPCVYGS